MNENKILYITPTKYSDKLVYEPHTGNKQIQPMFEDIAKKFNLKLYEPFLIDRATKIYYFTEYGLVCYPSTMPKMASECPKMLYQLLKGNRKIDRKVYVIGSIFHRKDNNGEKE